MCLPFSSFKSKHIFILTHKSFMNKKKIVDNC